MMPAFSICVAKTIKMLAIGVWKINIKYLYTLISNRTVTKLTIIPILILHLTIPIHYYSSQVSDLNHYHKSAWCTHCITPAFKFGDNIHYRLISLLCIMLLSIYQFGLMFLPPAVTLIISGKVHPL